MIVKGLNDTSCQLQKFKERIIGFMLHANNITVSYFVMLDLPEVFSIYPKSWRIKKMRVKM